MQYLTDYSGKKKLVVLLRAVKIKIFGKIYLLFRHKPWHLENELSSLWSFVSFFLSISKAPYPFLQVESTVSRPLAIPHWNHHEIIMENEKEITLAM